MDNLTLAIGIYIGEESLVKDECLLTQYSETLFYLNTNLEMFFFKSKIIPILDIGSDQLKNISIFKKSFPFLLNDRKKGRVFCFNKLLELEADYYMFLELSFLLGPNSLKYLLNELNKKDVGIVGPSSNYGWNKQKIFDDLYPSSQNILNRSIELYNNNFPKIKKLDSLLECCFIVSKDLIKKIGEANEVFKDGFCWEIDYSKRAKKAGYKSLWVQSAYVHKKQIPTRSSRNLSLLRNQQLLISSTQKLFVLNKIDNKKDFIDDIPLISCIMPTHKRAKFVKQAIKYFKQQTYLNTELIIVYDEPSDLPEDFSCEENIFTIKVAPNTSIGTKRNKALEFACGDIIAHWDDDDWYAKTRLETQAKPLLQNKGDISALYNTLFFNLQSLKIYKVSKELYEDMFVRGIHGGTLMYKVESIKNESFKDISLREDVCFLEDLILKGGRLVKIDGYKEFIYMRHDNNSWAFKTGKFLDSTKWKTVNASRLISLDMPFYKSLKA